MKYIGIDYGTKKTGIAVSDALGSIAFPRDILMTNKLLPNIIADIIAKEEIAGIVIGESKNLQGGLNNVAQDAKDFVEKLKSFVSGTMEIHYEDERFTTKQARTLPNEGMARGNIANNRTLRGSRLRGKNISGRDVFRHRFADAQAAAIILQSFLDKQKNMM